MNHIMLDIETLDTAQSAVVLSIGAVAFDPHSKELGDKFYVELTNDLKGQQQRGRTISADTVAWWMRQGESARTVFEEREYDGNVRVPTDGALTMFSEFVKRNGDRNAELWGNGSDFDNVIIGSLYDSYGMSRPWSYDKNRCFRTFQTCAWRRCEVPACRYSS